jgi:hypothetical protein
VLPIEKQKLVFSSQPLSIFGGGFFIAASGRFTRLRRFVVVSYASHWIQKFNHTPERRFIMDVHCTTCGEPWDVYHLRHDAIFETTLCYTEAKAWTELSPQLKLLPRYREKFKASGFEFGGSILNVMRCPACPKDAKPDPDKAALKAGIVEILGDDEDAIVDAMEDCGV